MFVLALTGPIASGKSAVMGILESMDIPTISADDLIHKLQQPRTPQTKELAARFGDKILNADGSVNRDLLGEMAAQDPAIFPQLEDILLPPLKALFHQFAEENARQPLVVYEIPLLFQMDSSIPFDASAACICPRRARCGRALKRPFMTQEKFDAIVARQPLNDIFMERADHIIKTDSTMAETCQQVIELVEKLAGEEGRTWPEEWLAYINR